MILSLQRLRTRVARAPWIARLLAAWVVLSLTFALTPCCEIVGAAVAAPASAPADRNHAPDAHDGIHDSGPGNPCATWLDRTDALPPKADDAKAFPAVYVLGMPTVSRAGVVAPARTLLFPRFSIPPSTPLYLRHARLIL